MPYIITTKAITSPDPIVHPQVVSRTAVATLDEAREAVKREACRNHGWKPQDVRYHLTCESIAALPESGGAVGPLPDGTVIEVREESLQDFTRRLSDGHRYRMTIAEAVEAFNFAQR